MFLRIFLRPIKDAFSFYLFVSYIIGHYNPSVGIIDLVSHTTYIVCFNFIHKWRELQVKVDSKLQIFKKLIMAILFALRVFAKNLLTSFTSNKPTHYPRDYGDDTLTDNYANNCVIIYLLSTNQISYLIILYVCYENLS